MELGLRDSEETAAFFAAGGAESLDPGVTVSYEWHPECVGEAKRPRPANSMMRAEAGAWAGVVLTPQSPAGSRTPRPVPGRRSVLLIPLALSPSPTVDL
ncbi:hypothetical protein [Streptomyces iconiensis]